MAVLENIVDSTNVGAIFRSAAALHIDAVLVTPSCCDPLCRRAVRVSMGTVFQVPWTQIGALPADWPGAGLAQLHELGFKTAALALSDRSVSIDDPALMAEDRLALILGTEGDGLSAETIAQCDYTVKIPMSHGVDSSTWPRPARWPSGSCGPGTDPEVSQHGLSFLPHSHARRLSDHRRAGSMDRPEPSPHPFTLSR